MALKIGQIRKSNTTPYLTNLDYYTAETGIKGYNQVFRDFAIGLTSGNFNSDVTYYLRFSIKRVANNSIETRGYDDPRIIKFHLVLYKYAGLNGDSSLEDGVHEKDSYQIVGESSYTVEPYIETINEEWKTFEVVFTPNQGDYKYLSFEMERISSDYIDGARKLISLDLDDYENRTIDFKERGDLCQINSILPVNSQRVGIQTRPGTLLCINREAMRVGRSGTLEINNGLTVAFVGILAPHGGQGTSGNDNNANIKDFILDYVYDE